MPLTADELKRRAAQQIESALYALHKTESLELARDCGWILHGVARMAFALGAISMREWSRLDKSVTEHCQSLREGSKS